MSKPKRFYWMKLKESFMTSDTIDYFMSQPDGANYVVLYQMLCLKTINTDGRLSRQIGEIIIPFDAEKIQRDCKWFSIDTVRVALKLYQAVGLVYEDVDGTLVLTDHKNLVGSETNYAQQKREQRELQKQSAPLLGGHPENNGVDNKVDIVHPEIEIRDRDKRLEIDDKEEEDIQTADEPPAPTSHSVPYESIKNLYNTLCPSFPKCTALSDARKKAIKARMSSGYTMDDFKTLFAKAENSSFLKGKNDRNWRASFDWLMKDANMAKVLDGNYDDSRGANNNGTANGNSEPPKRYGTYV